MFATEINYLAMVVAGVVSYSIGALWYSSVMFGKEWAKLIGLSEKNMKAAKAKMSQTYAIGFVVAVVGAFVLARLLVWTRASDLVSALKIGGWIWLGFVLVWMINGWLYEQKPIKLLMINAGYALVAILSSCAILILWR